MNSCKHTTFVGKIFPLNYGFSGSGIRLSSSDTSSGMVSVKKRLFGEHVGQVCFLRTQNSDLSLMIK